MKCKSCGAQMDPEDRFCRECGMPAGGGKKANNKEEGYADNIFSKSGRFDANYLLPCAILLGVLIIISGAIRLKYNSENPEKTPAETTVIETSALWEDDLSSDVWFV